MTRVLLSSTRRVFFHERAATSTVSRRVCRGRQMLTNPPKKGHNCTINKFERLFVAEAPPAGSALERPDARGRPVHGTAERLRTERLRREERGAEKSAAALLASRALPARRTARTQPEIGPESPQLPPDAAAEASLQPADRPLEASAWSGFVKREAPPNPLHLDRWVIAELRSLLKPPGAQHVGFQ